MSSTTDLLTSTTQLLESSTTALLEDATTPAAGDESLDWHVLLIMIFGQMAVWVVLYHRHGPLRSVIHKWVETSPEQIALVVKNAADVPTSGGNGEEGLLKEWSFWTVIGLHHGLGALIASISLFLSGDASIFAFRLGISFEIGEDFLHYIELAYAIMCPPGTEVFGEMYTGCVIRFGMVCHHAIGAFAGSYVFLHMPDWWEVQALVVLLLGAAVPQLLHYPAMPFTDLTQYPLDALGKACTWLIVIGTFGAIIGRLFFFPWLSYLIVVKVWNDPQYGPTPAIALASIAGVFCVFVLGTTRACGQYAIACGQLLWGPKPGEDATEEEKADFGKRRSLVLRAAVQSTIVANDESKKPGILRAATTPFMGTNSHTMGQELAKEERS